MFSENLSENVPVPDDDHITPNALNKEEFTVTSVTLEQISWVVKSGITLLIS